MTEILLIRHGETDWNVERRMQGHIDIPLNALGLRQAAALGRALRHEGLDAIIASDLLRARQTAEQIAAPLGLTVRVDPGLRERCYGAFEGLVPSEIAQRYPQAYAALKARAIDARIPDGANPAETLREFSERVLGAIARIVDAGRFRKVALVAHGGVLECAYRAAQGIGFDRARDFDIFNASINRFTWTGEALRLSRWGDVAHLAAIEAPVLDEVSR